MSGVKSTYFSSITAAKEYKFQHGILVQKHSSNWCWYTTAFMHIEQKQKKTTNNDLFILYPIAFFHASIYPELPQLE